MKNKEKLCPPVPQDKSILFAISNKTKQELDLMRILLNITGASKFNKQRLIEKIDKECLNGIRTALPRFDEERIEVIKKLINNDGIIECNNLRHKYADYFSSLGIAFTGILNGKQVLYMPNEVKEYLNLNLLKKLKTSSIRNTKIVKLTLGMLEYYGVISCQSIYEMLKDYIDLGIDYNEVFEIIYNSLWYYNRLGYEEGLFVNANVFDVEHIFNEQESRTSIKYCEFSYDELMCAADDEYYYLTPPVQRFLKYLTEKLKLDEKNALDLYKEYRLYELNDYPLHQINRVIFDKINIDDIENLDIFSNILMDLHNNMRLWILKGNSPSRLSNRKVCISMNSDDISHDNIIQFPIKNENKVGRNESCQCGSGKKYKKCCGK